MQQKQVAKSIGLIYRPKPFLGKHSLVRLYYSYIYTSLNYATLPWASTNRTSLKKLLSQQKHLIRMVNGETRFQ